MEIAMFDNLSLVLEKVGHLKLKQTELPLGPGPDEVLLETLRVGICGSDVHVWQHGEIAGFVQTAPIILGHESCARVMKIGEKVTNVAVGDLVGVEPGLCCNACVPCRTGRYNLCPDSKFHACPPDNGTLTRVFKHPASYCFKLPDGMSPETGALLEPLSVGIQACKRGDVKVAQAVLITGSGPIGLVTLLAAKAFGATHVCLVDVNEKRLQTATELGADSVVVAKVGEDARETANRVIAAIGRMPDTTIDCVGIESSVTVAIHATKVGGTVVNVGCGASKVTIPLLIASTKEIDFKGVFRYNNTWPLAIQLLQDKKITGVERLITHRFPLEEAITAFETAKSGVGIKVMINCEKHRN